MKAKLRLHCSTCPRIVKRCYAAKKVECDPCRRARCRKYYRDHKAARLAQKKRWARENRETLNRGRALWRAANKKKMRAQQRRYRKKLRAIEKEIEQAASCNCGDSHGDERRLSILKRMLPASASEIRDSWSCIWGLPGDKGSGSRMLYRDLEKLGTVRDGGTFYLQSARTA